MRVYEKIKKYMEDKGIKQTYVSEKTGIPENTLSMILNGKRNLGADEMVEIFKALEVTPNDIILNQ